MWQKFPKKPQQGPKKGRQRIRVQGRIRNTHERQDDGKKDNNPAKDKGKSGTIYRGGNTGVRNETVTRAGAGN